MVRSELVSELKVAVGLQVLWVSLTSEFRPIVAKIVPNAISSIDPLEGDGGCDREQADEKIVELDESTHKITLQVIEGGHLSNGYTFYKIGFKFTATAENETLVDIILTYEVDGKVDIKDPSQTLKFAEGFILALGKYLQPTANLSSKKMIA